MRWAHVLAALLLAASTSLAFLHSPAPPAPALVTSTRTTPLRRARASSSSVVRRHFTVGGEAPDGPSLQEVFNTATALSSLVVGGLVALELYQERPRGWVNEQIVEAAPSTLGPQAGRGLFATADIPKVCCMTHVAAIE